MKMILKIVVSMVALAFASSQAIQGMDEDRTKLGEDLAKQCALEIAIEQGHELQENILSQQLPTILRTPSGTAIFQYVYFADDSYFRSGKLKFVCRQWCEIMQSTEITKFVNYQILSSSALIFYKRNRDYWDHESDATNFIKLPTSDVMNSSEKIFDLRECFEKVSKFINISIGYRNNKSLINNPEAKTNIWMAFGHEIERELKSPPVGVHETRLEEWRAKLHVGLYPLDDDWSMYETPWEHLTSDFLSSSGWSYLTQNYWLKPKELIYFLLPKHKESLIKWIGNDRSIRQYLDQYYFQIKRTYLPLNKSEYVPVSYKQGDKMIPDEK